MSHSEILEKLDAVLALSGSTIPFSPVDIALIDLRSQIAQEQAEIESLEAAWEASEDYRHACTYASY
jgi:hypothetical protein